MVLFTVVYETIRSYLIINLILLNNILLPADRRTDIDILTENLFIVY